MCRFVEHRDNFDIILSPPEDLRKFDPLARTGTIGVKTVLSINEYGQPSFYGAWVHVADVLWYEIHHDEIADVLMEKVLFMDALPESSTPEESILWFSAKDNKWLAEK